MNHRDAHFQGVVRVVAFHRAAFIQNFSAVRLQHAGEDIHECGFAGAVLSHHGMDLAPFDAKIDIAQSLHARKGLRESSRLQYGRHINALSACINGAGAAFFS